MDFNKILNKRASIRNYSPKKISISKVLDCIQAANLSPSPGNLPLLKYIIIEDKKNIEKIAHASRQDFIKDSIFLVVVCSDIKDSRIMYDEKADKYTKQHAGAAIENFLLKITELGLASCWIGAFSDEIIKSLLKIPDSVEIEAVLPIAYQNKKDKSKQRPKPPLEPRIFFEHWKNKNQVKEVKIKR